MIVLALVLVTYVAILLLVRVQPKSLRSTDVETLKEKIPNIRATLLLGIVLIAIAMLTFNSSGLRIASNWEVILGESQMLTLKHGWLFQLVTNNFTHFSLEHLLGNLTVIALLSAYERRVGWKRYLAVFFVSALLSSGADLFVLPAKTITMGASAGICGLAAAYYLDVDNLKTRTWIFGIIVVLSLIILLSLAPGSSVDRKVQVNWVAHVFGALFGAIYVRIRQQRSAIPITES